MPDDESGGVGMKYLLAAAALVTALAGVPHADAACAGPYTRRQAFRDARLVFDGVALGGPSVDGYLLSPARFRVERYRKGSGPKVVRVQTAYRQHEDGLVSVSSELISPRRGQRWRIFTRTSPDRVIKTSVCQGSRRLRRS